MQDWWKEQPENKLPTTYRAVLKANIAETGRRWVETTWSSCNVDVCLPHLEGRSLDVMRV